MKTAGTISVSVALRSFVVALFGLVLMFQTSVRLSGLSLAILPLLLLSFYLYAQRNRKYTSDQLTASATASTVAEECFGSIRCTPLVTTSWVPSSHNVVCITWQCPHCRSLLRRVLCQQLVY